MNAALIIAILSLVTSSLTIIYLLAKAYDRYRNPQKYYHSKAESKSFKIMGDKIEVEKKQDKLEKEQLELTYDQAKVNWKLAKKQNWPNGAYAKPIKKNYIGKK